MAMKFIKTDDKRLNQLIDSILSAVILTEVSPLQAREAIAHVLTAAAIDDEKEVRDWLDPERVGRWKEECRRAKRP